MRTLIIFMFLVSFSSCTDENDKAIHDLLAVKGDTLIGAKWYSGLIITADGGKTWKEFGGSINLNNITIDDNGVLWGSHCWEGIHEAPHSRLWYSKDFGNNWILIEFDPGKFFPEEFVSKPNEKLIVLDNVTGNIFQLNGNNPKTDWIQIEDTLKRKLSTSSYKFSTSTNTLVKKTKIGSWDTLKRIEDISIPFEILESRDTLYIAAGGYGGYKALFASLTNDTILTKYEMESVQSLGVRQDSKNRIWTFGDGGIFMLKDGKLIRKY